MVSDCKTYRLSKFQQQVRRQGNQYKYNNKRRCVGVLGGGGGGGYRSVSCSPLSVEESGSGDKGSSVFQEALQKLKDDHILLEDFWFNLSNNEFTVK